MYTPPVSIIIRTKNERIRIGELLDAIASQDYGGIVEIIAVDTSSTDGTRELLRERGVKIVTITQKEFTYPKSINMGVKVATGELIILTVGHALPFRKDWISGGVRHFTDPKVAGVFGPPKARKDATWTEVFFYGFGYIASKIKGPEIADPKRWHGIMGATNCMLRRSLWEKHNFDEAYGAGGEDVAWANWAIEKGYIIIADPKFSVRHSHGNDWKRLKKQQIYWKRLGIPLPFDPNALRFRKDLNIDD